MKRFEFSLKKLLAYKQQILKREKNDLANLRKQQLLLLDERKAIIELAKNKNNELNQKINSGLSAQHIAIHKHFLSSLNETAISLAHALERLEEDIQKQLNVIIEITKEIDSLEKLEKKQLEEYTKKEIKVNELFIEEFVSHKNFHSVR